MSLTVLARQLPLIGRAVGLLVAGLTLLIAAALASPVSHSDLGRQDGVDTAYPLMIIPALAIMGIAGLAAFLHPAAVKVAVVVSGLTGIQVLGIAVVAARDWRNLAGVGYASWPRGNVASLVAVDIAVATLIIIAACYAHCRREGPDTDRMPSVHRSYLVAGSVVAVGLPLVLGATLHHLTLTAIGQFALWWSLPWGAGIIAAGGARERVTRRAALASVLVSATLTCLCAQAAPLLGFGLRLPEG